jgi:hypothetical protein
MAEKKAAEPKKTSDDKKSSEDKPLSKTAIFKALADSTGLESKQVSEVFAKLEELAKGQLREGGPGVFLIPGLVKLKLVTTPARKAEMRPNPFKKGEMMEVKAKPASTKVKPVILKGLKDLKGNSQAKAPAKAAEPKAKESKAKEGAARGKSKAK